MGKSVQFLVIDDGGILAATEEAVGAHMDMRRRRSSPLPPAMAAAYDRLLESHRRLPWEPPACGVMNP